MMKRYISLFTTLLAVFACGEKNDPVNPTPVAPTSMTVSKTSFDIPQAGETVTLDITSPTRPILSGRPDWITYQDGTYKDYKMTVGFKVEANETTMIRTAEMSFMAAGVSPVKVTVTQEGKTAPDPPTPTPGGDTDAWKMAAKLGLGWNMGNHFDGYYNGSWAGEKEGYPDETVWQPGGKATQATFTNLKRAGFTSVRIPVSWLKMIGAAPEYKIDETWLNRVYEVVNFAHNAGLYVIVNTHHDENHGVSNTYQWLDIKNAANNAALNTTIKAEIKAVWTQIAAKFKDCGDWLILESFNELNDGGWGWSFDFQKDPTRQCNILNEWNQVFVDAVRATGGNNATRILGLPGYCANPGFTITGFKMPDGHTSGNRIMVAVHDYDPYDYTLNKDDKGNCLYNQWGHTAQAGKAPSDKEESLVKTFEDLKAAFPDKGMPLYLGEMGCSNRSGEMAIAFQKYYLEYFCKALADRKIPFFLWDNGAAGSGPETMGYINHATGAFVSETTKMLVETMVKAVTTTDPSYTLQSVYNTAPVF